MPRAKGTRDAGYEEKRRALLRKMTAHMVRRDIARPSMRELAAAADVTVPTLRHYFGGRPAVIAAVLEEALRLGRHGLDAQSHCEDPFEESIAAYAHSLTHALYAEREVRLMDLFAVSLAEGMLDSSISRATLRYTVDPTIATLEARLADHVARGEMRETDVHAAALMLLSPILLGALHQHRLSGADETPMSVDKLADCVSAAFVRAFRAPESARAA